MPRTRAASVARCMCASGKAVAAIRSAGTRAASRAMPRRERALVDRADDAVAGPAPAVRLLLHAVHVRTEHLHDAVAAHEHAVLQLSPCASWGTPGWRKSAVESAVVVLTVTAWECSATRRRESSAMSVSEPPTAGG